MCSKTPIFVEYLPNSYSLARVGWINEGNENNNNYVCVGLMMIDLLPHE